MSNILTIAMSFMITLMVFLHINLREKKHFVLLDNQTLLKSLNLLVLPDEYMVFDLYFNDTTKAFKKDHLKNFAREIKLRPNETAYVISYAGKSARVNESLKNIKEIQKYLTKKEKIKTNQIVFIDGGYRVKAMTEFFFVPKDAPPPEPSPTLSSDEIEIIK